MQQPINRGDPNGTDFFEYCWDEMSNRSLLNPMHLGCAAATYKGNTSGVWDPNGVWARAMAAEEDWIHSDNNDGYQTPAHNQVHQTQTQEKMKVVRDKGKAGETAVGFPKNTQHIPSLTETAAYRVPDILNEYFVGEVKNYTWPVRLTPQLIDEILYADTMGIPFVLFTDAPLAPTLKQLYDNDVFILQNINK